MSMNLFVNNPLIERYRFSQMRPRQFGIYLAVYLLVLLTLLFINVGAGVSRSVFIAEIIVFQVVILWIWGAANTAGAIRDELSDKTYDFFRLLPLTAHQKAVGILIGKNLVALLFAAINVIFLVILTLKITLLLQLLLLLACGAFAANTLGLLSSIHRGSRQPRNNVLLLVVLLFLVIPILSTIGLAYEHQWGDGVKAAFYGVEIPLLIFLSLIALYIGAWAYASVVRKFIYENEPYFSRKRAILFYLGGEGILLGLFWPYLSGRYFHELTFMFWGGSLVLALFTSLASLRDYENYWQRSQAWAALSPRQFKRRLGWHSNLGLAAILAAIWLVFAMVVINKSHVDMRLGIGAALLLLLSYAVLTELLEIWALYHHITEKISFLVAVIIVLYLVVPLISAGMFGMQSLLMGSPLGILIFVGERPANLVELQDIAWKGLFFHLLLAVMAKFVINSQWTQLRENRQNLSR